MRALLLAVMQERGGVLRRDEARAMFAAHVVDDAVRSGLIVVEHPGVYRLAAATGQATRRRAALAYCPEGAISHLDALDEWGLPTISSARVHLTVGGATHPLRSRGIRLHRRAAFQPVPPMAFERNGLRVVCLEQAIVESWPLLATLVRRAPAVIAVRERRTTPQRLMDVLDAQPRTAGARNQRKLFTLLGAGNHSELEIWGHQQVLTDPRLPHSVAQHRVQVGSRYVLLDRAFLAEMLAVELDGAAFHGSPDQRERDLRRDAALAKLGWVTVRYSHPRLHTDPGGVVDELVGILSRRREQLRVSA
ncbi:MAG TPA: DUF559 domain-containing protein [Mycobacteriales bacterium]|nr:DUF559 domain-containing protein [Mycobacteriales bacterium]